MPARLHVFPAFRAKIFCIIAPDVLVSLHGPKVDAHLRSSRYVDWRSTVVTAAAGENTVFDTESHIAVRGEKETKACA